jgi:hypothetical protein
MRENTLKIASGAARDPCGRRNRPASQSIDRVPSIGAEQHRA